MSALDVSLVLLYSGGSFFFIQDGPIQQKQYCILAGHPHFNSAAGIIRETALAVVGLTSVQVMRTIASY